VFGVRRRGGRGDGLLQGGDGVVGRRMVGRMREGGAGGEQQGKQEQGHGDPECWDRRGLGRHSWCHR
jgi:hypothetical protein